jgi:riboflavin kinase/FMN adenylyltransferase
MLGRYFRYSGVVMLGDQRGRELGFPTANLAVGDELACPADAVYAGYLHHDGSRWPAAVSVGANPTFAGSRRHVEAYAIGRDDLRLYGERVGVDFVARLRGQTRFDSREALIKQMDADVAACRAILD